MGPVMTHSFWGDSILTRNGRPLLVYHGTQSEFDTFDPRYWEDDKGFFFTPRLAYARRYARGEKGRVISAYLRISNPYRCTGEEWGHAQGLSLEEAQDAGHDGYIVAPYELGTMFVLWRPENIHILSHNIDSDSFKSAA